MRLINFSFAVFAAASLCAATKPVTYDPSSSKLVHPGASALVAANPELGMAINLLKRDFYIYIDTIPSPADDSMSYGSYSRTNPFYYKGTDGTVARTVNVSGGAMSMFADYYRYYNISYWTDCELKVIDKWGNILYFTSTIGLNFSQVKALHPEITDSNPKIYFFGTYGYSTTGCYGLKTQFTNYDSSIGATIGTSNAVTGIWIYPDLNSTDTRTVKNWTGYGVYSGTKQVVWGKYIRGVFANTENTIIIWRQTTTQGETFRSNKLWRPAKATYYGDFKEVE